MEISKSVCNNFVVFSVSGRIDTVTAEDFQDKIDLEIDSGVNKVLLNFQNVEYVSSAGLRAILYLHKKLENVSGGELKIENVNESIMEVFEMTGFSDFLKIVSGNDENVTEVSECQNS